MVGSDRGQALTLEAITSAILLLAAISFALQMTAVTPLSASTSSQHLENQLQKTGEGVLASADESGALEEAVLYWNRTGQKFHETDRRSYYTSGGPPNEFGKILDETYSDRGIAFNVVVHHHTIEGGYIREWMVRQGEPSDHAVSSSRTVTLVDDDRLLDSDGERKDVTLQDVDEEEFYAQDTGDGSFYNHIRVEVIAWRL